MYDDDEDEYDEEEAEFVYRRGDTGRAQVALADLIAPDGADEEEEEELAQPLPQVAKPVSALPVKAAAGPAMPQAFAQELDVIKRLEGVTVMPLAKGVRVTVAGTKASWGTPALNVDFEPPEGYPVDALDYHFLPPTHLMMHDVHPLPPLIARLIHEKKGGPVLEAIIGELRRWLLDLTYRAALVKQEEAEAQAEADAKRLAEEERERREDEEWELEKQRQVEARIPLWAPLTPADEQQRPPLEGSAPCKLMPQLDLPRTWSLASARVGGRVFLYGGAYAEDRFSDELYVLHIASRRVERVEASANAKWPPGLTGHAMAALGKWVFVLGGFCMQNGLRELSKATYKLNTHDMTWTSVAAIGDLAHFTATAIEAKNKILVFGGVNMKGSYMNSVKVYNMIDNEWSELRTKGARPAARHGHSAILHQNRLVVFGGHGFAAHSDVWTLDLASLDWQGPVPMRKDIECARSFHTACMIGGCMAVYGGEIVGRSLGDLMLLDLEKRTWEARQLSHTIDTRTRHTAVLTGTTLLVVGGGALRIKTESVPVRWITKGYTVEHAVIESAAPLAVVLAPATVHVPPSRLARDLLDLCNNAPASAYADVCLGPAALPAHSFVLAARCPELRPALDASTSASAALHVPGLSSAEAYVMFRDFVYTASPRTPLTSISDAPPALAELAAAAAALKLPALASRIGVSDETSYLGEVIEDLSRQALKPYRPDFAIVAPGVRLPVHRALLACRSEYFRAMLAAGMAETTRGELVLPHTLSEASAVALQRFLYSDELDASCAENVTELLPFAAVAQLTRLQRLAEWLITDAYDLTDLDSVIALTSVAAVHHAPSLLSRCMFLLVQHFTLKRVMESPAWATLSPELQQKAKAFAA